MESNTFAYDNTKIREKVFVHSNLDVNPKQINHFPQYYQEIFRKWSSNLSVSPNIRSTITSQVIWFNKHIKIDNKSLCNNSLANQGMNRVGQLFNENGMAKAWLDIKKQFNLSNQATLFLDSVDKCNSKILEKRTS